MGCRELDTLVLLSTPYPPGQLFRNLKKLAPNPTLSESTVSQHEQDVSAWLVIFPSVDKDFGAEQAQVCVLHLGGAGGSGLASWQCGIRSAMDVTTN